MKLNLHHVNFASKDIEGMTRFYREVLGLGEEADGLPILEKKKGYSGDVAFLTDGRIQFHLARQDLAVGFKTGHVVNPVDKGHIAFRTDNINEFKKSLEEKGINYSDYGNIAVEGWHQIFFYDPDGNVIEVHQVDEC